jgi:2',3'-cyclic-nucleotide 2'-phosphodiesterase (5'-nucleotidase family)
VAGIASYAEGLGSPMVAANMDASEEPTLDGKFAPSVVIDREGTKIGIIGCISSNTPVRIFNLCEEIHNFTYEKNLLPLQAMSSPEKVKFSDEIPSVTAEATKLKSQGVQIIILLSHSGYEVDLEMAKKIPDLDIIVGAHSHTFLYTGKIKK